jgi:hypothetical protein
MGTIGFTAITFAGNTAGMIGDATITMIIATMTAKIIAIAIVTNSEGKG